MRNSSEGGPKLPRRLFLTHLGAGALGLSLGLERAGAADPPTAVSASQSLPVPTAEEVELADPHPTGVQDLDMALAIGARTAFAGTCCELEVREAFYFPSSSATLFNGCGYRQAHAINRRGQPQRIEPGQSLAWSDPETGNIEEEKMWVLLSSGTIRATANDPDPHDEPRLIAFARRPKHVSLRAEGLHVEMPAGQPLGAVFTAAPFGATRVQTTDRNDTRIQHHYLRSIEFKSHRWLEAALPPAVQREVDYWYPRLAHIVCDVTPTIQVDEESTFFPFPDVLGGERTRLAVRWWSVHDHNKAPLHGYDEMPHAAPFTFPDGTAAIKSIPLPALVSLCLSARSHRIALDSGEGDLAPFAWRPGENHGALPAMTRLATHAGGYAFMVDEPETERVLPPFSSITFWTFGADAVRRRDGIASRAEVEKALGPAIWSPLGGPDTIHAEDLAKPTAHTVESWIWWRESDPASLRKWLRDAADSIHTEVCDVPSPHGGKLTPKGYSTGDPRWDVQEILFGHYAVPSNGTDETVFEGLKRGLSVARWAGAVLTLALQAPDEKGEPMGVEIARRMVGAEALPLTGDSLQRWYHLCRYGSWHEDLWHLHAQGWMTAEWAELFGIAPMMARLARFLGQPEDYARMCRGAGWELIQAYGMMHSSEVLWRSGCFYTDAARGEALSQQPGTELWSDVGRLRGVTPGFDPDVGVVSRQVNSDAGTWQLAEKGAAQNAGRLYRAVKHVSGSFSIAGRSMPDELFYTGRSGESSSGMITLCDEGITPDGRGGFKARTVDLLVAEHPATPQSAPHASGQATGPAGMGTGGCLFDVYAASLETSTPPGAKEWIKLNTASGGAPLNATAPDDKAIYAYHFSLIYHPTADRMLIVLAPRLRTYNEPSGQLSSPAAAASHSPSLCGFVFRNGDGSQDWTPAPGAPSFTGARSSQLLPGQGGGITSGAIHHPSCTSPGPNPYPAGFLRAAATLDSGFAQRHYCRRQMMAEFELATRYGRTPIPGRGDGRYWLVPQDTLCPFANAHWAYWPSQEGSAEGAEGCYIPVCDLDLERVKRHWKDVGCTGPGTAGYTKMSAGTALTLAFAVKPPDWKGLRPRVDLWPARSPDDVWYRASGDGYSKWGGEWVTPLNPPRRVDGLPFPACAPSLLPVKQSLYYGSATARWWPEEHAFGASANTVPTFSHLVPVAIARYYTGEPEGGRCRYGKSGAFGAAAAGEFTLTIETAGGRADAGKVVSITGLLFKARTALDPARRAKDLPYLPAGQELKVSLEGGKEVTVPPQKDGESYTVTGLGAT